MKIDCMENKAHKRLLWQPKICGSEVKIHFSNNNSINQLDLLLWAAYWNQFHYNVRIKWQIYRLGWETNHSIPHFMIQGKWHSYQTYLYCRVRTLLYTSHVSHISIHCRFLQYHLVTFKNIMEWQSQVVHQLYCFWLRSIVRKQNQFYICWLLFHVH